MNLFEYIDILNKPYDLYLEIVNSPEFLIKPHWHYYSEILYVTEGCVTVNCKEQEYKLEIGDLLFIFPQSIHSIYITDASEAKYIVIKCDLNTLQIPRAYISTFHGLFPAFSADGAYFFPVAILGEHTIRELCFNCLTELEHKAFAYDYNVRSNLSMLLVSLARVLISQDRLIQSTSRKHTAISLSEILEYIDAHSNENLQVSELADKCGMSYSNFAKIFKQTYGRTCKEYIEYIRINKAEEMVLYSNHSLSYIALENGFADCSHFIRTYKKFRNKTPKQTQLEHEKQYP